MGIVDRGAPYDFGGATFDLDAPTDRRVLRFVLSQALYGEATGVYCGLSLYSARSLRAAEFYVRQARQELSHLRLFAEIFRELDLTPEPGHWVMRLLSTHNDYYPVKVLLEHAVGEGLVLDVFRDLLLATLPDSDPRVPSIKKKLRVICREEEEHVAWGEAEVRRLLREEPWLRTPYEGLVRLELAVVPLIVRTLRGIAPGHPVLAHLDGFVARAVEHARAQARELGILPPTEPDRMRALGAVAAGLGLYARSRVARRTSRLEQTYLGELGFE